MKAVIGWMLSRKIFILRSTVFFTALGLTLISPDLARNFFFLKLIGPVRVFHFLWALVMLEMILALIPGLNHFIGRGKLFEINFKPRLYELSDLLTYTKKFDRRAVLAAVVWLAALLGLWLIRLEKYWIVMTSILFYYIDQLFVNVWCPFREWIVRNRCCATCRIYSWGFPIIVSPLLYIKSFWSYSLVAMGAILLIQWEFLHYRYPERFSEVSNAALLCGNCNDRCNRVPDNLQNKDLSCSS